MTAVVVHPEVITDIAHLQQTDPQAADAALETIHRLQSGGRGGIQLDRRGWRGYPATDAVMVITTGVGTGTIRIIGVGQLPTLYDRDRLRTMAQSAEPEQAADTRRREAGVPAPAPRSRIIALTTAPDPTHPPQQPARRA